MGVATLLDTRCSAAAPVPTPTVRGCSHTGTLCALNGVLVLTAWASAISLQDHLAHQSWSSVGFVRAPSRRGTKLLLTAEVCLHSRQSSLSTASPGMYSACVSSCERHLWRWRWWHQTGGSTAR